MIFLVIIRLFAYILLIQRKLNHEFQQWQSEVKVTGGIIRCSDFYFVHKKVYLLTVDQEVTLGFSLGPDSQQDNA